MSFRLRAVEKDFDLLRRRSSYRNAGIDVLLLDRDARILGISEIEARPTERRPQSFKGPDSCNATDSFFSRAVVCDLPMK